MEIHRIPVRQIHPASVRVTAQYDEEHAALLKQSVAALGIVTPIILVAVDDGYEVVDGLHRWQEAIARGDLTVDAVIHDGGPAESMLLNLILNKVRGKVRASEMVAVIRELWQTHHMDSDAISKRTGLTRDYIERLQRISQAAPSVQEALDAEVIGVGQAYEVSRLPSHAQQDECVARLQLWRMPVRELRALVDQTLQLMQQPAAAPAPVQPAAPAGPPVLRCEGCQGEVDARQLRAVALCPECYGQVYRLARAAHMAGAPAPGVAPPP